MKPRLLFIDHDFLMLSALRTSLSELTSVWDMEFVASAAAALEFLEVYPVDLIVVNMDTTQSAGGAGLLQDLMNRRQGAGIYVFRSEERDEVLSSVRTLMGVGLWDGPSGAES